MLVEWVAECSGMRTRVQVKEILQEKAVFLEKAEPGEAPQEKRVIKAAELPKHPIPKSAVTVSMLAWIIIAKYCDALPLYRQEKILARYGGSITRTTMANWLIRLSLQLQPLINLMADHQRAGHIMNADETRIQVLKESSKSLHSDKYMWVTLGGPPGQPAVLFHYDPSRGKEVPLRLFEAFSGYLQTDGYASYSAVCKQEGITQVGCFDHVRRKFTDAKKG
ncbi:IS66 family transposase, partial [Salinisphaera sp. G21_0]|uniref:IS66 family transposase n=1 Tax=Salinisphaera sp. G21_0 TaxID=2821094 RepID=UPI001ADA66AD